MDQIYRHRRLIFPKRTSELIALLAVSTTLFLFIHTRDLNTKLKEMEVRIQPDNTLSGNQLISGDNIYDEPTGLKATMKLLESTGEMSTLQPMSLNNTMKAQKEIVFFNRVPKVGSQTLMELLRRLSIRNDFGFHQDRVQRVETIRLSPEDQADLAALVSSYEPPGVYIKHVCFTNVSFFGLPEPIYINLVRDPIERVISWYYYVRAPWYYVERKLAFPDIPLPDPKWLKKDFETCVLSGDKECRYVAGEIREGIGDHRRQSMFFCGHHPNCLPFNTQGALEMAKRSVEQHYAVVGVLEDLNTTLTVLEKYIPRFFSGAFNVYWREIREGIGDHRRQSMFFCGHHPNCLPFNTQGALEMAKRSVEQHYAVVGVLEDLNTTLTVLEKYIPRFFSGAFNVYWNEISRYYPINKNLFKPPVDEKIKDFVRKNFTKEIEFYEFCKQRLHKQYLALKLPQK